MWCTATSSDGVEHPSRSGIISLVEFGRRGARPDIGHHGLLAQVTGQALRKLMFATRSGFCGGGRASAGTADAVHAEEPPGVASIISGHDRCGRVSQSSDFGCKPADSAILRGDRLACGAESALAIGELDFGGLAALLRLVYCAAQLVDLCAGCEWRNDLSTPLLVSRPLGPRS